MPTFNYDINDIISYESLSDIFLQDGNSFQTVLYNDTVTFVEGKAGMDGEMLVNK